MRPAQLRARALAGAVPQLARHRARRRRLQPHRHIDCFRRRAGYRLDLDGRHQPGLHQRPAQVVQPGLVEGAARPEARDLRHMRGIEHPVVGIGGDPPEPARAACCYRQRQRRGLRRVVDDDIRLADAGKGKALPPQRRLHRVAPADDRVRVDRAARDDAEILGEQVRLVPGALHPRQRHRSEAVKRAGHRLQHHQRLRPRLYPRRHPRVIIARRAQQRGQQFGILARAPVQLRRVGRVAVMRAQRRQLGEPLPQQRTADPVDPVDPPRIAPLGRRVGRSGRGRRLGGQRRPGDADPRQVGHRCRRVQRCLIRRGHGLTHRGRGDEEQGRGDRRGWSPHAEQHPGGLAARCPGRQGSVDRAARLTDLEQRQQSTDLAPAAEVQVIAQRPAAVGARRRLLHGEGAEMGDQVRRVLVRAGGGDVGGCAGNHPRGLRAHRTGFRQQDR